MEMQIPPTPPPPPPRKPKTGLLIGLVIGAVLLLCLCIVVIFGVLAFQDQIPGLSGLFATPTLTGEPYSSPRVGIRLVHPYGWVVYEDGSSILQIATSQAALDSPDTVPTEAYAVFLRDNLINIELYPGVEMTSTANMMDFLVAQTSSNLTDSSQLDRQTGLTLVGYPAETVTYTSLGDTFRQVNDMAVILSGDIPTTVFFSTSESAWESYRPTLESILYSLSSTPEPFL